MDIIVEKHSKLHLIIFVALSLLLFIFSPASFFDGFLAAMVCVGVFTHIGKIRFQYKRWYEVAVFLAVNAYLTLAFFGYDLFLENSLRLPWYLRIFCYALGFIWTSYVLQSALDMLESFVLSLNLDTPPDASGKEYWKKWLILFAILCSVFMIWQLAYNPIVLTPDSWAYIDGWRRGIYYQNYSPMFSFLVTVVCTLAPTKPEVQWVSFTLILSFSALISTILMYLYNKGIRFTHLVLAAFILPLIPPFGLNSLVIWQDLSSGMSILWFTYVLMRIFDEVIIHNTASKKQIFSFCVQLYISMVGMWFFRPNTFLIVLVMAPILAVMFICKRRWELLSAVVLSAVLILLIRFPGYKVLNPIEEDWHLAAKYWAGIHDMQATYYAGGDFSEQTLSALRKYIPRIDNPNVKKAFKPDNAQNKEIKANDITTQEFISMYTDSFLRNPFKMAKSMLFRGRGYWVIDTKGVIGAENVTAISHVSMEEGWRKKVDQIPELNISRQRTFLTKIMDKYIGCMLTRAPATFIWRYGIWTALIVVSIMRILIKKRYIWLLTYLPTFVCVASLLLAAGWPRHRYGLGVLLVGMFVPLMMLVLERSEQDTIKLVEIKGKKGKRHKG